MIIFLGRVWDLRRKTKNIEYEAWLEQFFLKYPSLWMCTPENYREVSEHVGKHVDVCSHLLSFGILPLVAACQGLLMWKLSFVTEVLDFSDPNCIQLGGNLIIPLKILLRLPIRRRSTVKKEFYELDCCIHLFRNDIWYGMLYIYDMLKGLVWI